MESRIFHFFLTIILLLGMNSVAFSAEEASLLDTKYEAKVYKKPDIEVDDFELSLSTGLLSIEDFGTDNAVSLSLNYHVSESLFIQAGVILANASKTSFEVLTNNAPLLTSAEREFSAYHVDVGYNLLSGEGFFSENHTYSTDYYLIAGIGTTNFAGNERFTYNYGTGFKVALSDWLTLSSEFRNYVFDMDVFGTNKSTNNLSFTLGVGVAF